MMLKRGVMLSIIVVKVNSSINNGQYDDCILYIGMQFSGVVAKLQFGVA